MNALLLAWLLTSAWGQEPSTSPPASAAPAEALDPWAEALNGAIQTYLEGNLEAARQTLQSLLQSSSEANSGQILEARTYLAEVQYYQGKREDSWHMFQLIVSEDPDFRLDPFIHPPEVVAYFDSVRAASRRMGTTADADPGPSRISAVRVLLPGGWQFYNGQTRLGVGTSTVIGSLAIANTALYLSLRNMDNDPNRLGVQVSDPISKTTAENLKTWTNLTRFAGLGFWSGAIVQGWLFSRDRGNSAASILLVPGYAGLEIALHN